jgi:putative transposase
LVEKKKIANSAREDRMALLDEPHSELSLKRQAELLSLNRSGLYYQAMPLSPEEVALKHRIDQIYTECPFYGSRRIAAVLHQAHL